MLTLAEAEAVIDDLCHASYPTRRTSVSQKEIVARFEEAFNELCLDLGGLDADTTLMEQYVTDARRDDDDDQKEGMTTGDYCLLAQEELFAIYEELGLK